jgi:hypothetical protein
LKELLTSYLASEQQRAQEVVVAHRARQPQRDEAVEQGFADGRLCGYRVITNEP